MANLYYERGPVRIFQGDSLEWLSSLGTGLIDAVVTDPPYGIGETAGGPESRAREKGAYKSQFTDSRAYVESVCVNVIKRCIELAPCVAVTPGRTNIWLYPSANDVGCFYQPAATGCSFWGRPTWQPILFYGTAPNSGEQLRPLHYVLTEAAPKNGHPCPKPLKAWTWLVEKASKGGSVVCDPFTGSGTTAVACIKTGRQFVGCELEESYCEIARRRCDAELDQGTLFGSPKVKPMQRSLLG